MGKHFILEGKRQCYHCKKIYPLTNEFFYKNKVKPAGFGQLCKKCHRKDCVERSRKFKYIAQYHFYALKYNTRKRKMKVSFTKEEFIEWYYKQSQKCYYCDISLSKINKLKWGFRGGQKYGHLTIDRIDNSQNYKLSNMVLACLVCNFVKGWILTVEEMKEIGQKYIKPKWKMGVGARRAK